MTQGPPQPPEGQGWGQPPQGPGGQQPGWGRPPPKKPDSDQDSAAYRVGHRLGRGLVIAALLVIGMLVVLGIIGALFGDDSAQPTAQPSVPTTLAAATTLAPTTTSEPATTAKPTTTAAPKPIPSKTILRDAVVKALGESNRDVKRLPGFTANEGEYIVLTWRINENLTEGLTKDSARLDAVNILKAIKGVPEQ